MLIILYFFQSQFLQSEIGIILRIVSTHLIVLVLLLGLTKLVET